MGRRAGGAATGRARARLAGALRPAGALGTPGVLGVLGLLGATAVTGPRRPVVIGRPGPGSRTR
jgi:hypothetical protein